MRVSNNRSGMGRNQTGKKQTVSPPSLTTLASLPSFDRSRARAETEEMCGWTERVAMTETWQVRAVCALRA